MTNEQQPEPLRIAALLEKTGAQGSLRDEAASELRRLHAELETLRTGYEAVRLEIESLRAAQPGAAYATRPDEREAFEAMMRSQTFDSLKRLSDGSYESYEARVGWLAWNVRAAHGQAPAQAAPATVAGPSGYGPNVTVRRSCSDCKACNSESYAVQGDSGHYVYCEHPSLPESKYIGDTNWNTPHWCPVSAPTTQPAPKQEAQEPTAVVVPCHTPSGKRVALYSAKQDLPIGTQLYTATQPAPAAQEDVPESEYRRGYRHGYEQRDAEVRGALV